MITYRLVMSTMNFSSVKCMVCLSGRWAGNRRAASDSDRLGFFVEVHRVGAVEADNDVRGAHGEVLCVINVLVFAGAASIAGKYDHSVTLEVGGGGGVKNEVAHGVDFRGWVVTA